MNIVFVFLACRYTSSFKRVLCAHKIYHGSIIMVLLGGSMMILWQPLLPSWNTCVVVYTNSNGRKLLLKGNWNNVSTQDLKRNFCSGLFQRHLSHSYCKQQKKPILPYNKEKITLSHYFWHATTIISFFPWFHIQPSINFIVEILESEGISKENSDLHCVLRF